MMSVAAAAIDGATRSLAPSQRSDATDSDTNNSPATR